MKWPDQLRLTPLLMVVATLMFSVKVQGVYRGVTLISTGVTKAQAETPSPQQMPSEPAKAPEGAGHDNPMSQTPPSPGEMDVLQSLAARRDQLDQRANELEMRDKLLRAAEDRVGTKITELKKIEASIKALIEQQDAVKEAELQNLVRVYSTMKAKEAAPIFDKLDMTVLISMIQRMPPAKIAPILAIMDPKKANELTIKLASIKTLPDAAPEGLGDGPLNPPKPTQTSANDSKPQGNNGSNNNSANANNNAQGANNNQQPNPATNQPAPPQASQLRPPGLLQPLPGNGARAPGPNGG